MTSTDILPLYINKLSHPMKEIRERALQLLLAKFRLGWELEDELADTRALLDALLSWFDTEAPSMHQEALELLVIVLKTKSGTYIAKELGIDSVLNNLNKIKNKIKGKALDTLEDLVETLHFLNTVDSQVNIIVPPLKLNSETSSHTNGSSNHCYNGNDMSSDESFVAKVAEINVNDEPTKDGILILLYPWVELSSSDLKTIILIGDSLKVLKSTRRCCRFIRNVFLRDFPVEVFLNRPTIIKTLSAISDGQCGGHPVEALHTLLCITQSLHSRFSSLFSLDFVSQSYKIADDNRNCEDNVNEELEQFASLSHLPQEDNLVPLRQLPAPIYALETLHTILTIMTRSVVLVDMNHESDILDMKELNICLCLVESLIALLLMCVTERFWSADHTTKTHRDIAHKSCMAMRMLGELVMKYRTSFTQEPDRIHYRVAWLRLVPCGEKLLHWARESALPPTALVAALQAAHIDPALELMYPEISRRIASVLFNAKSSIDKEYKSRYKELSKLFISMDHAMQFMKLKDTKQRPEAILNCMKNAIPILYINLSEKFLSDIGTVLLKKLKDFNMNDDNWSLARSISLTLMAHNLTWVQATFYKMLAEMVKTTLMGDDGDQAENEKCLTLICDVGILTEICCHGLSSTEKEVEHNATEIMLYLLRGRLALSDGRWWRLLASLLPVLPLLHAHAAHDTLLGKAICKSLEADIVQCMGVSTAERVAGLTRLLFVNCATVQLDAAHSLCRLLDDEKYLPPREVLRADVIMNALRRVKPQDFNINQSSSPSKNPQTSGLIQIMEVLKQDLTIDEETQEYRGQGSRQPALEPSLRRSTLQQLALLARQQELHDTFLQYDGLNLMISLLKLSLMVDDYLAFPECAISCVSVLNSVCFKSRHNLAKITDLPLHLLRVILIFPANDECVVMAAQVLSLVVWAGFALQELDAARRKVPALPAVVVRRTTLPFLANNYWSTSPNAEHSSVEWLLTDEVWRSAIRVRWWWLHSGGRLVFVPHGASPPGPPAPPGTRVPPTPPAPPTPRDLALLRAASLRYSCTNLLLALENATSHIQVYDALNLLECYTYLIQYSPSGGKELEDLPWHHTRRFLSAPPASSRDTSLLISLLQFVVAFMDNTLRDDIAMSWIQSSFIGNDAVIISLLSRDRLYPQQTAGDDVEVTQLRIFIVKVVLRCILLVEHRGNYTSSKMESLLKILLTCLERIDLKNFHVLGYLNELIRCIRYAVYSQYCRISAETLVQSLRVMTNALSGCASGAGRKGQACRLDAMLTLLALLKLIQEQSIPVQRWSDAWGGKAMCAVGACAAATRAELRAAALLAAAALAQHAPLRPHLLQGIGKESLSQFALEMFFRAGEANAVRAAAACLLTTVSARISPNTQVTEKELLQQLAEADFIEECLNIFIEFCNDTKHNKYIEPNVPLSVLERGAELEVRAHKTGEFHLSPSLPFEKYPPSSALISSLADAVHNLTTYKNAPVQAWNDQGLYRVLFKCVFWSQGPLSEVYRVRTSTCRALAVASMKKCVRTSLAGTKDCLYNLLVMLTPFEEGESDLEGISARAQALYLLASLLPERAASDAVWWELKKNRLMLFDLLLQALKSENNELQDASLHCITQLTSYLAKNQNCNESSKYQSYIDYFDNLPSSYSKSDLLSSGDSARENCRPEYMVEEICNILINIYQECSEENISCASQDARWTTACTCACGVLAGSARARRHAAHRALPRRTLRALHALRDALALHGKPADIIRNANHEPMLITLNWVLTLMSCLMYECPTAKDHIAEDIAPSLTRLWPWCMMNEQLRDTLMNLLVTFTNDCPKAWAAMCSCTGARSLAGELCALVAREAARPRPAPALPRALTALAHCAPHHHCRAIMLKSDVLSCICKLRARGASADSAACAAWARLCAAVGGRADGAAALLALLPVLRPVPAALLPALARAAHHHRLAFLQSPDLLEYLSSFLLTGNINEVVLAARAVWALAANNHRAKLVCRNAGVVPALAAARRRLLDAGTEHATRALELLTYTHNILQTT